MIRAWLCRKLQVDSMVKAAFMEGYNMACSIDPIQCHKLKIDPVSVKKEHPKLQTWRSAAEAWANSDAEEMLK